MNDVSLLSNDRLFTIELRPAVLVDPRSWLALGPAVLVDPSLLIGSLASGVG